MNHDRKSKLSINRILVVVDPQQFFHTTTEQSGLLRRASKLAETTGAELELFYPYHDPSLELSLFVNREEINLEKERIANRAATRMAELALQLNSGDVNVSHEVRWDHPPADAILRKIADSRPDLVMKQTRAPDYILGLADHSDWDLIRKSPVHLWFVKDDTALTDTVLTAVGGTAVDEGIITDSDREIFEVGNSIARYLEAQNRPVHCYQVPEVEVYAAYAPSLAGLTHVSGQNWDEIARLHGQVISNFAEQYGLSPDDILISKGHPAEVLPEMAKDLSAGLLVMGARNLGRWHRLFSSVAAEPVLADAPCDVFFVKESEEAELPEARESVTRGVPEVDLEMAITNPENAFKTPQGVVETRQLTRNLRERILDIWDHDVRAQLTQEEEGGPIQSTPANLLKEINEAKASLAKQETRRAG